MTDILLENIKLVVLFALIVSVIIMSHFGGAAPAHPKIRQSAKPAPAVL
jgi:hypothetical protein